MSFSNLIDEYPTQHVNRANKALHWVGIPSIIIGILLLLASLTSGNSWGWPTGLILVFGGSILLGIGHRLEGNRPAFTRNPLHLLAGPAWQARELWRIARRKLCKAY